jgi:pyruvate dehydrogenase E2 component (dihydrolipoamide acetyltransferase)
MATPLNMPQMGYDMHEGTLVRWLKSEDDEVSLGEPIAEIETDKAVVEVEATAAGLLRKILAAEGTTVPVGQPIAIIGEAGEDIEGLGVDDSSSDDSEATAEEPTGIPLPPPIVEPELLAAEAPPESEHEMRASPVARRLAAERGIDLSLITGTGPGNRITRDDVLWYKPPEPDDEDEAVDEEPAEPVMEAEVAEEEPAEPAMEAEPVEDEPAEPEMEAEAVDEVPDEPVMEAEAAEEEPAEPAMEAEPVEDEPAEPEMEAEAVDEVPAEPVMEAEAAEEEPAEPAMEDEPVAEEPAEPVMEAEAADEEPDEPAMEAEAVAEEPAEPVMEAEAADEEPDEPAMEAEVVDEVPDEPVMEAEAAEAEAAPEEDAPSNVIPLSRTRRQIARVTARSKQEIPHFYVSTEIDMSQAMEMRRQLNNRLDDDSRVSVNDLVVKASVDALQQYPSFNASYSDDGIVMHDTVNVGLAIAQDDGLLVPALLDCAGKSLVELATASKDLARRAGSGALHAQEYAGATFAISNMGMFGVSSFVAIIQPPQSAILAVGAVAKQAVVRDGGVVAADMMTATLSADHRVVDGADGARFIGEIKHILENPFSLLL